MQEEAQEVRRDSSGAYQNNPRPSASEQEPVFSIKTTDTTSHKACNRCVKSRRVCPGYKDETTLLFRHYEPPRVTYKSPVCWWMPEVPDDILEERALSIFLAEFIVESRDRNQSRGFLDGMQSLVTKVHPGSSLAMAAKVLVLASIANRTGRESLAKRTQRQYGLLLQKFTESLSQETAVVSIETLYTAVLLGIYEIIVSNESSPMQHKAHVQGVCAILRGGVKPFDITKGVRFYSLGNPLLLKSVVGAQAGMGVLCAPISHGCLQNLDAVLIKFSPLFERAEELLVQPSPALEDLLQLQREGLAVDEEFLAWGTYKCSNWAPITVGHVRAQAARASGCPYVCEGPVDKYFDYYVAAVWNTWRKAQLIHIDVLARLAKLLGPEESIHGYEVRAKELVAGLKASIPYYLAVDIDEYLRLADAGPPSIPPNRPVGGLLLLHPLYAAARCTIVPRHDRMYFLDVLNWIGEKMGIGQSTLLANTLRPGIDDKKMMKSPELPFMDMGEGHILIWAGMMLEPTSPPPSDTVDTLEGAPGDQNA
ncbi:Fc.00g071980.m01.CDS01 [Cosmosporella sp. VM-42]